MATKKKTTKPVKIAAKKGKGPMAKPAKKTAAKSAAPAKKPTYAGKIAAPAKKQTSAGKLAAPAKSVAKTAAKAPVKAPVKAPTKPGTIVAPASRVPARTPERAEELKAKIGALASSTNQIRALKRSLSKSFWDIGTILGEVQTRRLYEAKGYGSFEAFVEREIDLGKQLSLRLVKIAQLFIKEAALAAGLDRVTAGLLAFEGDSDSSSKQSNSPSSPPPAMPIGRSALPPHKQ